MADIEKEVEFDVDDEDFSVGSLVTFSNITPEQREIFIKLLSDDFSYMFQVLFNVLEDDALVLELVDIFADKRITFPPRKRIYKLLEKVRVYTYVKNRNYSEDSYVILAKQYKKRISQIKSMVKRVDYLLNNGNPLENKEED